MATTLYLRTTNSDWQSGNNDTNLAGAADAWFVQALSTTRGAGVSPAQTNTVAGPTSGIEVGVSTAVTSVWVSPPLDADVTISGSITWNIWASESNMSANVAINGRLEVIDGATGAITLIDQTARTTEVAVTTRAVNNFSETPAAGVACKRGDRLRVRIFGDDSTANMASGYTWNIGYDGATGGADGDTFLTLTENLTFVSEPAGTTIYPTDTLATAAIDSDPKTRWRTIANRLGSTTATSCFVYANGYWVGVASQELYTATDPGTWTLRATASQTFRSIAYGNNYWVAVGDTGQLYYRASGDPQGAWTSNAQGSSNFTGVTYGNGYFVAVGSSGVLYYATDPSAAWTLNSQGSGPFYGVAYGNGWWVAAGATGGFYRKTSTPDGAWTSDSEGTSDFNAVRYLNGNFVLVRNNADGVLHYAADPSGAWTTVDTGAITLADVGYLDGYWLGVNLTGSMVTATAIGGPWTQFTTSLVEVYPSIAYGSGTWVVGGATGDIGLSRIVEREAWTSRGAGVSTDDTSTVAGWTSPFLITDTTTGNTVEWFTKPLQAFTLGGAVRCNIRGSVDTVAATTFRVEIARVDGDGTNPTVWGATTANRSGGSLATSEDASSLLVSGDDLAVSNGQRLRIRVYLDDHPSTNGSAMISGRTVTLYYAGTSGGASGDTYLTFTQTLSEFTAAVEGSFTLNSVLLKTQAATFTLDAVIFRTYEQAATLDAVLSILVSGSFALDAVIFRTYESTFPLDAVIKRLDQPGSFTLDAITKREVAGSFALDAVIKGTIESSRTLDAVLKREQAGSFALDAIRLRTYVFGPGLTTSASDAFTGTDGTNISGRTADIGGVWGTFRGTGQATIQSNAARFNGSERLLDLGTSTDGVQNVYVTSLDAGPDEAGAIGGVFARGIDANNYYYLEEYVDAGTLSLKRRTANAVTLLGSDFPAAYPARLRLNVSGSSPTTLRARTWDTGSGEPSTWDLDLTDNTAGNQTADGFYGLLGTGGALDFIGDDFLATSGTATDGPGILLDAVLSILVSGSFTLNAVIFRTYESSLAFDAVVKREQVGTATLDAVLQRTQSSSFALDAVILRTYESSSSIDAVIKREQASSLALDAVLLREQSASFTLDAELVVGVVTVEGSFTVDAIVLREQVSSFSLDAIIKREQVGSLTLDAVIVRTYEQSASLDSVLLRTYEASSTLDAIVLRSETGAFSLDAIILRVETQGASLDAVFFKTYEQTATLDAVIMPRFELDGVLLRTEQQASTLDAILMPKFELDAVLLQTVSSTFTIDAFVAGVNTFAYGLDAVFLRTEERTFSTDALVKRTVDATLTLDSILYRVEASSFTLDAVQLKNFEYGVTADAVILATRTAGFTVDAVVLSLQAASFSLDAVLTGGTAFVVGFDAILLRTSTASVTLDAVLLRSTEATYALDASVRTVTTSSLTVDAVLFATSSGSATVDAVLLATSSASFSIDAVLSTTRSETATLDAYLAGVSTFSFLLESVLQKESQGQLGVDAVLRTSHQASLLLDAFFSVESVFSFALDAVIATGAVGSFVTDAYLVAGPPTVIDTISAVLGADFISANNTADTISAVWAAETISAQGTS